MDNFDNFFDNGNSPQSPKTPIYHTEGSHGGNKNNIVLIICIVMAVLMTVVVIVNVVILASLKNSIAEEYAQKIAQQMYDQYSQALSDTLSDGSLLEDVKNSAAQNAVDALGTSIGEVAEKLVPSVARIYMYENKNDPIKEPAGMATAFLITDSTAQYKERYLVTNAHCARYVATSDVSYGPFVSSQNYWAGYERIIAMFDGEEGYFELETVAYGGYSDKKLAAENTQPDLALLRVTGTQPSNEEHPSLKIANSDYTKRGEPIALIGNPEYVGFNSITTGCVSQSGIEMDDWGSGKFVLTDAALNSGNSGGPMIDRMGVVVGVAESKLVEESIDNMGFALSAETLRSFIEWACAAENNSLKGAITINCTYVYPIQN